MKLFEQIHITFLIIFQLASTITLHISYIHVFILPYGHINISLSYKFITSTCFITFPFISNTLPFNRWSTVTVLYLGSTSLKDPPQVYTNVKRTNQFTLASLSLGNLSRENRFLYIPSRDIIARASFLSVHVNLIHIAITGSFILPLLAHSYFDISYHIHTYFHHFDTYNLIL